MAYLLYVNKYKEMEEPNFFPVRHQAKTLLGILSKHLSTNQPKMALLMSVLAMAMDEFVGQGDFLESK